MIKAVIFDMDGVMIDSEPMQSLSWEKLLQEYNIQPIYNDQGFVHEIGPVDDNSYKTIMAKHNLKEELGIVREKRRKYFIELIKEKGVAVPGLLKFIRTLKGKKLKVAVASNRIAEHVYSVLEKIQVKHFFDVVMGRTEEIIPKPSPDIFLKTSEKLNVEPSDCLVLEDSQGGVEAGKAAGMKVIAIATKHTKHHDFSKADLVVNSLEDIKWSTISSL